MSEIFLWVCIVVWSWHVWFEAVLNPRRYTVRMVALCLMWYLSSYNPGLSKLYSDMFDLANLTMVQSEGVNWKDKAILAGSATTVFSCMVKLMDFYITNVKIWLLCIAMGPGARISKAHLEFCLEHYVLVSIACFALLSAPLNYWMECMCERAADLICEKRQQKRMDQVHNILEERFGPDAARVIDTYLAQVERREYLARKFSRREDITRLVSDMCLHAGDAVVEEEAFEAILKLSARPTVSLSERMGWASLLLSYHGYDGLDCLLNLIEDTKNLEIARKASTMAIGMCLDKGNIYYNKGTKDDRQNVARACRLALFAFPDEVPDAAFVKSLVRKLEYAHGPWQDREETMAHLCSQFDRIKKMEYV